MEFIDAYGPYILILLLSYGLARVLPPFWNWLWNGSHISEEEKQWKQIRRWRKGFLKEADDLMREVESAFEVVINYKIKVGNKDKRNMNLALLKEKKEEMRKYLRIMHKLKNRKGPVEEITEADSFEEAASSFRIVARAFRNAIKGNTATSKQPPEKKES